MTADAVNKEDAESAPARRGKDQQGQDTEAQVPSVTFAQFFQYATRQAMPGRRGRNAPVDTTLCRRCQINEPSITGRNDPLCTACFVKYVFTKVVKRMESFRVRHSEPGQDRYLLLPLSFGPCSTALLYILDQHLKGQIEKTGRTGFKLHILHVEDLESTSLSTRNLQPSIDTVRERFPDHGYTTIPLSDILARGDISRHLAKHTSAPLANEQREDRNNEEKLSATLDSTTSATSRADLVRILLRKVIVDFAERHACEAVLFGDSTTTLAEKTLAETAKGRGFSLPWIMADGYAPQGIPCYYPVRDLLSKELTAFVHLVEPSLDALVVEDDSKPTVSTKNTTIDDLMRQYFESVEQEYPSIVANVVKTTGKLNATSVDQVAQQCELCDMPLDGEAPERSRLCYGCIRTLPSAAG